MQTSVTLSCSLSCWHIMGLSTEMLGGVLRTSCWATPFSDRGCQAIKAAKDVGEKLNTLCMCVNGETSLEPQTDQHRFNCFQA